MTDFECLEDFYMSNGTIGFKSGQVYSAYIEGIYYVFDSEVDHSHKMSKDLVDLYFIKPFKLGR